MSVLDRGIFDLSFSYFQHASRIRRLLCTYGDQPMSVADACLVRMAEVPGGSPVVTTDADFRVYRTIGDEPLDVRLPAE